MRHSPEYYEILEQTADSLKTITIKVNLKDEVNPLALHIAVQKAAKSFPHLAVRIMREGNEDIKIVRNEVPVPVLRKGAGKIILGCEEIGGHLLVVQYENRSVYFCCLHALCGPEGYVSFFKTALLIYLSELHGETIVLPPADNDDRAYFSMEKLRGLPTLAPRKIQQGYSMFSDAPFSQQIYYEIRVDSRDFTERFKPSGGSPTSVVTIMMFKAMDRILPKKYDSVVAAIAHNYRNAVGCGNSSHNFIRSLCVNYPRRIAGYGYDTLTAITRGQIILESQNEISVAAALDILGNHARIDQMKTLREKREYAVSNTLYGDYIVPSFVVSYPGNVDFGEADKHIDSLYSILTAPLGVEVIASGTEFFICLMMTDKHKDILQTFKEELESGHVRYRIDGPFTNEIMGFQFL